MSTIDVDSALTLPSREILRGSLLKFPPFGTSLADEACHYRAICASAVASMSD